MFVVTEVQSDCFEREVGLKIFLEKIENLIDEFRGLAVGRFEGHRAQEQPQEGFAEGLQQQICIAAVTL